MKKVVVGLLGGALLLAGIALLVLPGPGFLVILAGLVILATQFDWAKKRVDFAKGKAQQGIDELGRSRWRTAFAVLSAVGLAAVGVLSIAGVDVPFINLISAVLLILSGIFLLGTIIYARMQFQKQKQGSDG